MRERRRGSEGAVGGPSSRGSVVPLVGATALRQRAIAELVPTLCELVSALSVNLRILEVASTQCLPEQDLLRRCLGLAEALEGTLSTVVALEPVRRRPRRRVRTRSRVRRAGTGASGSSAGSGR